VSYIVKTRLGSLDTTRGDETTRYSRADTRTARRSCVYIVDRQLAEELFQRKFGVLGQLSQ
jgi:hypothetical protein